MHGCVHCVIVRKSLPGQLNVLCALRPARLPQALEVVRPFDYYRRAWSQNSTSAGSGSTWLHVAVSMQPSKGLARRLQGGVGSQPGVRG